jgi:hypothetical protein
MNMHVFHETQSRTYVVAFAVMVCISIAINFLGGSGLSIEKRGAENAAVIAVVPAAVAPLVWRARCIQRVTDPQNVGSTAAIPRKIGLVWGRAHSPGANPAISPHCLLTLA